MADRVIGPVWYGYPDESDFRPSELRAARPLTKRDGPALHGPAEECGPTDREHGAMEVGRPPIFGALLDAILVAAACFTMWEADRVRSAVDLEVAEGECVAAVLAADEEGWP